MNALRYLPGDWFALVSPQHVILLPGTTAVTEVSALWERLHDAATVESLLTEILTAAQMKISSMPPFAIVSRDAAPHVVVRGEVSVATNNGSEQARGRDVATWLERRFGPADQWDVSVGAADEGHWLPIAEGIVRVSGLRQGGDPEGMTPRSDASIVAEADADADADADAQAATDTATATPATVAPPSSATPTTVAPATPTTASIEADVETRTDAEPEAATEHPATGMEPTAVGVETETKIDAAPEKVELATAAEAETAAEVKTEPATEARATAEPDTQETAGQLPEDNTEIKPDHGGDSLDRSQVSLASELLGRRDDTVGGHVAPIASSGPAASLKEEIDDELEDDIDDSDTILTPRGRRASTQDAKMVPAAPAQIPAPAPNAAPAQVPGLISGMPWMRDAAKEAPPVPPKPAGQGAQQAADIDDDEEGHTILRGGLPAAKPAWKLSVDPAGQRSGDPAGEPGQGSGEEPTEELDAGLSVSGRNTTSSARALVLARSCNNGHINPPTAANCKKCGSTLRGAAHQMPRPPLGKMIIADGPEGRETVHELTRSVLLGRQPSADGLNFDPAPQLVQVQSPSSDISRNHLQVRIDGWHVELVDMGATNGSMLLRAGHSPRRLARNEAVLLLSGDVADLGDGVSVRFEELP
ncbi:FHA domain-containing protein [Paeniglutamicibacter terrestris]|uniref:FHA domain-containing protein n=1 Tax=Paeniglutamicibacter terrestris TaxID=2723403 RepID=A0ABX1G686_9MICC|nr:FHA domain-containing protein [Paeniglutamicibacter terrestris]NKG21504.1 FHA domain-containing protein [Paeniglutamicibacter terrestris]